MLYNVKKCKFIEASESRLDALRNKDYEEFVDSYNGSGRTDEYAPLMEKAEEK